MHTALKFAMASTLALATAAPAMAQYSDQYRPTQDYRDAQDRYQQQQQQYQPQRDAYESRRAQYDNRREGYAAARADYEARLAAYNRARADYDRRYGYGAYVRVYGPAPVWDSSRWAYVAPSPYYAPSTPSYGYNTYAPAAPSYGYNSSYTAPEVKCDNSTTVGAGEIGAI